MTTFSQAPRWAKFIARDADGRWYWYKKEPAWVIDRYQATDKAMRVKFAYRDDIDVLKGPILNRQDRQTGQTPSIDTL